MMAIAWNEWNEGFPFEDEITHNCIDGKKKLDVNGGCLLGMDGWSKEEEKYIFFELKFHTQ